MTRIERAITYTERYSETTLAYGIVVFVAAFWGTFAVSAYVIYRSVPL